MHWFWAFYFFFVSILQKKIFNFHSTFTGKRHSSHGGWMSNSSTATWTVKCENHRKLGKLQEMKKYKLEHEKSCKFLSTWFLLSIFLPLTSAQTTNNKTQRNSFRVSISPLPTATEECFVVNFSCQLSSTHFSVSARSIFVSACAKKSSI